MRKALSIALVFFPLAFGCTRVDIVTFPPVAIPDAVFAAYCLSAKDIEGNLSIDLDGDGIITRREASLVEEIQLENEGGDLIGHEQVPGVQSLEVIEYFTSLRRLNVGNNSLTALDVSRNTRLTYLNCSDNRLTSLVLPADNVIETLNCNGNDIARLDASKMPALKYLYSTGNRLTALDVGGNPALVELSCDRNSLSTLDVGGCGALTDLSCAGNGMTSIVLPRPSSLVRLDCGANELNGKVTLNALEELDLTGQDKLSLLRANANPLTTLDISSCVSLRTLECVNCRLSELDIRTAPRLRSLAVTGNPNGMKIYVPSGFDPSGFLFWDIGDANVVEEGGNS